MKPTLLFTTLTMMLATSSTFAKSELETLRTLCAEQERQIRQLEDENMKLRDGHEVQTPRVHRDLKASVPATSTVTSKPEAPVSSQSTYTVKAGDSIDKIARKVGTSEAKLAKVNGLKPASIIHPGQKLKVPGTNITSTAPTAAPAVAATAPAQNTGGKTHTVRQGETFFSISKKHGISTATLVSANPKVKASELRPGQVIRLGGSSSTTSMISAPVSQAKAPAPAPVTKSPEVKPPAPAPHPTPVAQTTPPETPTAAAPAPASEKETASAQPEKKFRPVTIEGEMTYGEFAAKHGTDADRLNALNGLDLTTATVLAKGSELYVPAQP